jgi:predicted  nucleic acid-binding Zn-ribbon protein
MSTKDQERKALEQIKKIIEGLGPDSYLDTTFKGVIEQAADNIENDFACNYMEMYESATAALDEMKRDAAGDQKTIEELRQYNRTLSIQLDSEKDRADGLRKDVQDVIKENEEYMDRILENEKRIETLESEIITLKAKLYDLMTV